MKWFVAVSGNIGSGKSALTTLLSEKLGWRPYYELFTTMIPFLHPPDLIIYLRASVPTLVERIRRRTRDYEQGIPPECLGLLNERYREWTEHFTLCPMLTVDADHLDLDNLDTLVAEMRSALPSLFPLSERP